MKELRQDCKEYGWEFTKTKEGNYLCKSEALPILLSNNPIIDLTPKLMIVVTKIGDGHYNITFLEKKVSIYYDTDRLIEVIATLLEAYELFPFTLKGEIESVKSSSNKEEQLRQLSYLVEEQKEYIKKTEKLINKLKK